MAAGKIRVLIVDDEEDFVNFNLKTHWTEIEN